MASKLISRTPNITIILSRVVTGGDGKQTAKRMTPKAGVPFEFTQEEIDFITKVSPNALRKDEPSIRSAPASAPVVDGAAPAESLSGKPRPTDSDEPGVAVESGRRAAPAAPVPPQAGQTRQAALTGTERRKKREAEADDDDGESL